MNNPYTVYTHYLTHIHTCMYGFYMGLLVVPKGMQDFDISVLLGLIGIIYRFSRMLKRFRKYAIITYYIVCRVRRLRNPSDVVHTLEILLLDRDSVLLTP